MRSLKSPEASPEALKALYENGATIPELADRYGLSRNVVWVRLHKANTKMRRKARRDIPAKVRRAAVRAYQQGKGGYIRVARKFGVAPSSVRNWVIEDNKGRTQQEAAHRYYARFVAIRPSAVEMYKQGKPLKEIGRLFGISGSTVQGWAKAAGVLRTRSEAAKLRHRRRKEGLPAAQTMH